MNTKRAFNNLLLTIIIMLVGLIAYGTYLIGVDVNPPVEYYNLPFPTDKDQYRHGEEVIVTVDYCKYTDVPFMVYVRYVDGLVFSVPDQYRVGGEIGCKTLNFNTGAIPDNLPPGRYYIDAINEYKVNFLVKRTVEWTTTEFDVIE